MNPLRTFYDNTLEKEAVQLFLVEQLRELAADMAIEGEDTSGIKEANKLIIRCFDKLDEKYGKIEVLKDQNSR